jgi:hypothetical protein
MLVRLSFDASLIYSVHVKTKITDASAKENVCSFQNVFSTSSRPQAVESCQEVELLSCVKITVGDCPCLVE